MLPSNAYVSIWNWDYNSLTYNKSITLQAFELIES